jgi:hypothetical protein
MSVGSFGSAIRVNLVLAHYEGNMRRGICRLSFGRGHLCNLAQKVDMRRLHALTVVSEIYDHDMIVGHHEMHVTGPFRVSMVESRGSDTPARESCHQVVVQDYASFQNG